MSSEMYEISIKRFDPEPDNRTWWETYKIPTVANNTVLGALLYIRENEDPTLVFRFSCRFKNCGLCAVTVNGVPKMACRTKLEAGMRIEPLKGLKPVRDLVVVREEIFKTLRLLDIYFKNGVDIDTPHIESEAGKRLRRCNECLACLSTCEIRERNPDLGGPFYFVKLAQLLLDPRDSEDRKKQAKIMGIDNCFACERKTCYCLNGIDIRRDAIETLLES